MIEFTMPALGSDMDEGTLNEWLIKPGDTVTRGQVVAVVETTKAAVDIECWHEGTIGELLVPTGQTIQVGTPLATILGPGEAASTEPGNRVTSTAAQDNSEQVDSAIRVSATAKPAMIGPHHRRWVSPAARRLAQTLQVDVDTVTGSGPQGAVTLGDIEHAAAARHGSQTAAPEARKAPEPERTGANRASAMRQSIAAAMSRSKREIPHYYLADEIVLETALRWLTDRNSGRSVAGRILPAALQLKAVALAAHRFGEFNGFWRDDEFQPAADVHVGVAISLRGGGLVAPAIHNAADKTLDELMGNLTDLVARARSGSLRSSEMTDPSITVTNLGDQGVETVFGVIYPPQVALVGFGRPTQRVCAIDGGIRISPAVRATLAADHRASDGHRGALFLAAIRELLQQPHLLEKGR